MTDPEAAAQALEDMATSCQALAAAVRLVRDTDALGSVGFVVLVRAYCNAAARSGRLFEQWTRELRLSLERGASAQEN